MKATKYIGIAASMLLLVIVPVTLLATRGDKSVTSKAANFNDVTVFVSPVSLDVTRGEPFELKVAISTGKNTVGAADVVVTYDPEILVLTSSSYNEQSFKSGNVTTEEGKAVIHIEGGLIGDSNIASLSFHPLKRGATEVAVSEETILYEPGGRNFIPHQDYSAKINIR